jgi:hypothetical protein
MKLVTQLMQQQGAFFKGNFRLFRWVPENTQREFRLPPYFTG